MRYAVSLSYDGSGFFGWQVQSGVPSVQACLEHALSTLLGAPVCVTGAGRTDTGVHAVGYVAHFDIEDVAAPDPAVLAYKLNAILPPSVVVHALWPVAPDFHARFDASQRKYTYFLHRMKDPFVEKYSLRRDWDLDFEAMNRAAALLVGRHDFACFEKTGTDVKTSVCTVTEAYWAPYTPTHVALMGFEPAAPGPRSGFEGALPPNTPRGSRPTDIAGFASSVPASAGRSEERLHRFAVQNSFDRQIQPPVDPEWRYMYFRISADRFLRNMVRAVVGTLLEVGRGKRSVDDFASLILDAGHAPLPGQGRPSLRGLAGDSVPGHALFFSGAEYGGPHPANR